MNETTRDNPDRVTVSTFSGLTLQAAGLGWLAAVVRPGDGYATPAASSTGSGRPMFAAAVATVGVRSRPSPHPSPPRRKPAAA